MVVTGEYVIVKLDILCFVGQIKDGALIPHCDLSESSEFVMNNIRRKTLELIDSTEDELNRITKAWKKFQASKEFMDKIELELNELRWKGFDLDKHVTTMTEGNNNLRKGVFELTDLMLQYNVPIHSLERKKEDGSFELAKGISKEDLQKIFDNLKGK